MELQQALDSDDGAATQSVVKAPTADTAGVATAQAVDATTVEYEDITVSLDFFLSSPSYTTSALIMRY